ncbi:phospholipase D-like domain-containing protein, partial [Pseudofulvimonas gallinarii]
TVSVTCATVSYTVTATATGNGTITPASQSVDLGERLDGGRLRFLRNRAFAISRKRIAAEPDEAIDVLRWLEQVVRTLDQSPTSGPEGTRVHFSPGEDCLRELLALCLQCRQHLDICVYTIADDRLSEAILACHRRGITVRLISDNDKKFDDGSDVRALRDAGIPVRVDNQPHDMHHKFALFDRRILANGSFNWTPQRQSLQRGEPGHQRRYAPGRRFRPPLRHPLATLRPLKQAHPGDPISRLHHQDRPHPRGMTQTISSRGRPCDARNIRSALSPERT